MIKSGKLFVQCLLWFVIGVSFVLAQDPTGKLQGQVSDPSSAGIPGALVTVRNEATGLVVTQPSSRDGASIFLSCRPANTHSM